MGRLVQWILFNSIKILPAFCTLKLSFVSTVVTDGCSLTFSLNLFMYWHAFWKAFTRWSLFSGKIPPDQRVRKLNQKIVECWLVWYYEYGIPHCVMTLLNIAETKNKNMFFSHWRDYVCVCADAWKIPFVFNTQSHSSLFLVHDVGLHVAKHSESHALDPNNF